MLKDFLRYLAIDTQSSHKTGTVPSTNGQLELAKIVAEDLKDAGAKGVELTEDGFLYACHPFVINHQRFYLIFC